MFRPRHLYKEYSRWSEQQGLRPVSFNLFIKELDIPYSDPKTFLAGNLPIPDEAKMKSLKDFLSYFQYDPHFRMPSSELFQEYLTWCRSVGSQSVSRNVFGYGLTRQFGPAVSFRTSEGKIRKGFKVSKSEPKLDAFEI